MFGGAGGLSAALRASTASSARRGRRSASSRAASAGAVSTGGTTTISTTGASSDDLVPRLLRAPVYNARDAGRQAVSVETILQQHPDSVTVVAFLRRFGCPVCRAVSAGLSLLRKDVLDRLNVRLIAIASEAVSFDEFDRRRYFDADVFVDAEGGMFRWMELKSLGLSSAFAIGDMARMQAAIALTSTGPFRTSMDYKGNTAQLGGLFILSPLNSPTNASPHFLFEYREKFAGDTPTVNQILTAIDAPPDLLEKYNNVRVLDLARNALDDLRQRDREHILQAINMQQQHMQPEEDGQYQNKAAPVDGADDPKAFMRNLEEAFEKHSLHDKLTYFDDASDSDFDSENETRIIPGHDETDNDERQLDSTANHAHAHTEGNHSGASIKNFVTVPVERTISNVILSSAPNIDGPRPDLVPASYDSDTPKILPV